MASNLYHDSNEHPSLDDALSLKAFVRRYPDIFDGETDTERAMAKMRWLIFKRKQNRLEESRAVIKREGKWYVVCSRFRDWFFDSYYDDK